MQILEILGIFFGILSSTLSAIAMIIFTVIPWSRRENVKKIFSEIFSFYETYAKLNPCLLDSDNDLQKINIRKIKDDLMSQKILYYGLPKFEYYSKENKEFSPSLFRTDLWVERLSFKQIKFFYNFWKRANKKINEISNSLEKKLISFYELENYDFLTYWSKDIEKTKISLCPKYDNKKLHDWVLIINDEKNENNNNSLGSNYRENFLKQLIKKEFSLEIKFKSDFPEKEYIYSILFKDYLPIEITPYYYDENSFIDNIDQQEFLKHKKIIEERFNLQYEKMLSLWPKIK